MVSEGTGLHGGCITFLAQAPLAMSKFDTDMTPWQTAAEWQKEHSTEGFEECPRTRGRADQGYMGILD